MAAERTGWYHGLEDFSNPFSADSARTPVAVRRRGRPRKEKEERKKRGYVLSARRRAVVEELAAHAGEAGYGLEVARREGVTPDAVRYWLKKAGVAHGLLMHQPEGKVEAWRRTRASNAMSFEEAHPVTEEDKAAPPEERCGFTLQRCHRARRCEYNMASDELTVRRVMGRAEVCALAMESPRCAACGARARCGTAWRCWFLEHDGVGRDLIAFLDRRGKMG